MNKLKKGTRKLIAIVLTLSMSLSLFSVGAFAQTDITNHWAGDTIKQWQDKGLAKGYSDGTFKPEALVTRAEFMNFVNNAFGFTKVATIQFKDVTEGKWYYEVVQKAMAAGYIGGYPDGTIKPNSPITRQEAAAIMAKLKGLSQNVDGAKQFKDVKSIDNWSLGFIGAVVKAGFMSGYPDGSFKAKAQIKRGEAVVALDHTLKTTVYNTAGTFGPATGVEAIEGNVIINTEGVVLQNLQIKGNLTISEAVGEGEATLNNVTVDGQTFVRGGGKNSIHINGGVYHKIIIEKTASGAVRIVATDAKGTELVISEQAAGETVVLEGNFEKVILAADNMNLLTQGTTQIAEMEISQGIIGSEITLAGNTTITKLTAESSADISGAGQIIEAKVNADGVTFENPPVKTIFDEGVTPPTTQPTTAPTATPGNTGTGGGSHGQSITGTLSSSIGTPNLSLATIQLKQNNVNVGSPIRPTADGRYRISEVSAGTNYTISANLEGYYEFTTAAFSVVNGTNISAKDMQISRKEPIITTQDYTTVTRGTDGLTITIDLTSGMDYETQIINLGHRFADSAVVENINNWDIETGTTGFTLGSITRVSDTQVEIAFTGTAVETRAFSIQALSTAVVGAYAFDSNILTFSVVDAGTMTDSTGSKEFYYAVNTDVDSMKGVVVLVHGLAEHLGRYNEVAEGLNTAGYGTYRLDHKGHGRTGVINGDSGNVEDFSEYYKDMDILVNKAISENPGKPIYMLGHSMGGLLTAMYGVTYTSKLDGQIISGGATGPYYLNFGLDDEAFYTAVGGADALVPNSLTSTVCRYPAIQAYYFVDPLRLTEYTRRLQWETFGGGSKYLEDKITAGKYTYPTMIVHGGDDRIVSKTFSQNLYNNIDSGDKSLKIYNGLYHESLNERNEKTQVLQDMITWLDARAEDKVLQTVSGTLAPSDETSSFDITTANIQLKKGSDTYGDPVHPAADGSYSLDVPVGTGYTIVASMEGYYDFSTATFAVTEGTDITNKDMQIARKEPIITTQNYVTVTTGTAGVTVSVDLTSGMDYEAQVINLGHTFAEASVVEDVSNWNIVTGTTGLTLNTITKISDTQVDIDFTGTADVTRAFTIQALAGAIVGDYAYDSNVLTFSVVDDGLLTDSTGNKKIYYAVNTDVDSMKAIVIIVHGLAEHLGRYNEVTEALNAEGYGTYRLDNKGHGQTGLANSDSGYVENFSEYYEDIDLIVEKAKSENPGVPVYMLGHSMGGLLTAMYGATYTNKLDGQILSGAATGPYYLSFGLDDDAFYARFGGPDYRLPNSLTSTVCRYPAIQNYYFVDPLRLTDYTAKLYWETFAAGSKYLADQVAADNYTYPVLIIHGGDDRIVSKAFSESLYENIDSTDKQITIHDGLFHESLNEKNEKAGIIQDIIDWLDAQVL